MADKFYLSNRLKYHTASRVANQTGDSMAAAFNVDGHIVRSASVWSSPLSDFPLQSNKKNADPVGATENLVEVFKTGATSVDFWNGGKVWSNPAYPAVKLYENVTLTPVGSSLGQNMNSGTPSGTARYQAYEILAAGEDVYDESGVQTAIKGVTSGTIRVTDWVAPPAIIDPATGNPVAGYSGKQMLDSKPLQVAKSADTQWGLGGGHWEFVYMAGILTFEMGCTPQELNSNKTTGLTLTAFKYCGEYLSDSISGINDTIDTEVANIDKKIEDAVTELNTNIANAKEIAEVKVVLADGAATPADSGKTITSAVSDKGVVTMTINAEVLSVKQGTEVIQPDMVYAAGVTTLTADYGTAPAADTAWTLTYRI